MDPNQQAIDTARQTSQEASKRVVSETQATGTLPDMLREALNKKFSTSNPLIQDRERALTGYMTAATEAPLRYTPQSAGGQSETVYTPQEQANLIQGYRAPFLSKLATTNDLIGLNTGGIENVIGATSRAAQSNLEGLRGGADVARQSYLDLLGEQQSREQMQLEREKIGQGGSSGMDLSFLLPLLLGAGQQSTPSMPTEQKPFRLPVPPGAALDPNQAYFSPQGEWYFDFSTMDWIPVTD